MQGMMDIARGVDKRDMCQRLREVSGLTAHGRIVLLSEQADIVGNIGHALEELARPVDVAQHDMSIGEPKRASKKRAFDRLQLARSPLPRIVTKHEAVSHQVVLDCGDGTFDPRIVGGQEAQGRKQQKARVEVRQAVSCRERVVGAVEAAGANVRMNLVANRPPAVDRSFEPKLFSVLDAPVESQPTHRF